MAERARIAIVDDDPGQRQLLDNALARAGFDTVCCADGPAGLATADRCDLMLLDVRMPGMSGLEVLAKVKVMRPDLPVILLTAYIDVRDAVAAIKQGALDYLEKPVDLDELIAAVDDALGAPRDGLDGPEGVTLPPGVVAESPAMRQVFQQALRSAGTDAAILISGESGTGKQVIAEFIQQHSLRRDGPFVTVNCGAIPENLIESELFGHEKGAFTGADRQRAGRFEEADRGTLFLDEIGELPVPLQPVLLRVLESGRFHRIGGSEERRADVRLIAATNRDLEAEVKAGRFRDDLYYRVNVFPLTVPPLAARREDILPLAARFLKPHGKRLAPAAERCLLAHGWPGNVRELRNALERAAILAVGQQILASDLPDAIRRGENEARTPGSVLVGDMEAIQRQAILEALEKTGGNKTRAAQLLGISRRNLIYKLRDYGM
ncbi:MAG: sigma-54-dependent Fis family transcriptional regulator [Candidatus Hydrogenedentes bacterium]|nr:sigma-54-dependent Fis family transcriptional regulator [Candidatus Hydrogenedentota bacterium]